MANAKKNLNGSDEWANGYYDIRGYIDREKMSQSMLFIFIVIFAALSYSIAQMQFLFNEQVLDINDVKSLDFQKLFFAEYKQWLRTNVTQNLSVEFLLNILISASLPLYLIQKKVKHNVFLADIQANLASLNLNQYYLHKYDLETRTFTFKLIRGASINYQGFLDRAEDLKQLFDVGKLKASRNENDKITLVFSEVMPDKDNVPKMDFKPLTGKDKLFLGISDTNATPVYGTQKEQGNGLLNGNWLIVGGSGSGKSFTMVEFMKNFLTKYNYPYIDKIYIINYKASADYNFLQPLDKVEYADDIAGGLKILKKVQLDMMTKYKYNSVHSIDNFTAYQTLVIIDEVQTLNETLESKSLHKIMKNTVQESLAILEFLGSKIRASNGSLINILQKADVSSLPSTAYRSNLRNRFMLKQENISSAHLVVNNDITEKNALNPLELKQGQYIYWDMLTNELQDGFTVQNGIEFNIDELNQMPLNFKAQEVLQEVHSYKEIAIEAVNVFNKMMDELEKSGKKTFYDTFEDIEKDEMEDIFAVAEKSLAEKKSQNTPQEKSTSSNIDEMELFNSI
ncbi:hypothetical protein [Sulfurimonas xiamenensis]|uniref:FtsK domain-containing protein n=1 Tax=Sulfurimonas xiamenensis TaxID=2590021 RepID=A0AAJ4A2T9_9BACT|nr:hypothetical protein [Sulfurimonas xiamenensis]QFR42886.1 hypothetical protein FJR47_02755 [Sulfurimonas xiamenensis]